jgi:hypothetical protein
MITPFSYRVSFALLRLKRKSRGQSRGFFDANQQESGTHSKPGSLFDSLANGPVVKQAPVFAAD